MKVYNIGTRPIVYDRKRGINVIHPRKFIDFSEEQGKDIIGKFKNACSESDYEKFVNSEKKKSGQDSKGEK